ncbi:hypothetical protein LINPERPRIM_LOCUS18511 [Linum perenne]
MASGLVSLAILATLAIVLALIGGSRTVNGEETTIVTCEKLDQGACAYAVSSTGKRCVLEKRVKLRSGTEEYSCRTSEIEADKLKNLIETDECVKACGLERKVLGISSDSLLEAGFTRHLCSPQCYDECPNIVDLYFNLAAGEGVFLPKLCASREGKGQRRELIGEIKSSGGGLPIIAPGPIDAVSYMIAPSTAPVPVEGVEAYDYQSSEPINTVDAPSPAIEPPSTTPVPAPEPINYTVDSPSPAIDVPSTSPVPVKRVLEAYDDQSPEPISSVDAPSPDIFPPSIAPAPMEGIEAYDDQSPTPVPVPSPEPSNCTIDAPSPTIDPPSPAPMEGAEPYDLSLVPAPEPINGGSDAPSPAIEPPSTAPAPAEGVDAYDDQSSEPINSLDAPSPAINPPSIAPAPEPINGGADAPSPAIYFYQ